MIHEAFKDEVFKRYYIGRMIELEDTFAYEKSTDGACYAACRLDMYLDHEPEIRKHGLIDDFRAEILGVK